MGLLELLFLADIVLFGFVGFGLYFNLLHFRNIYTQKICEMNRLFLNLDQEGVKSFQFSSFRDFKISKDGEKSYPPKVYKSYFINKGYRELHDESVERERVFSDRIKGLFKYFLISLGILSFIFLITLL